MPGRPIRTFTVLPHLPERLQALQKLAYNLWWCWNHEAGALFTRIDSDLFEQLDSSPVKLLGAIDQTRLEQLLRDDGFLAQMPSSIISWIDWFRARFQSGEIPPACYCVSGAGSGREGAAARAARQGKFSPPAAPRRGATHAQKTDRSKNE